jgi:cold shock CspA family protein
MYQGKIIFINHERHFGFLTTEANERLFFHLNNCDFVPAPHDRVSYNLGTNKQGACAVSVTLLDK